MLTDLRAAFRQLLHSPGLNAVIVFTLALGIGANTAIFSFFYGILLRPLPVESPARLVLLEQTTQVQRDHRFAAAGFVAVEEQSRLLDGVAACSTEVATLSGRGTPEVIFCAVVSQNFFSVLGARTQLGRGFTPVDFASASGSGNVRLAVTSDRFWREHLGGDPDESGLGQSVTLNPDLSGFTIVGVMPPGFEFPRWIDLWLSPAGAVPERVVSAQPADTGDDTTAFLRVLGRLRDGASMGEAESELTEIVRRRADTAGDERRVRLVPLRDQVLGNARGALALLLGCVALVLVITCVNVANLLLARATTRQREMGIRAALGGSRGRIVRQLLVESLLLAGLGGLAGVFLGLWGTDALLAVAPTELPRLSEVHSDGWVVVFAAGISVLTGVAFGLAPALHAASFDLTKLMKEDERTASSATGGHRLRDTLVAAEVAVSLVLLIAAGLLLRSFWRWTNTGLGLDATDVVTARVGFPGRTTKRPRAGSRCIAKWRRASPRCRAWSRSRFRGISR